MSEHLSSRGVSHLVVERHRIAERWRSERWDSLVANGPAWHDRFPDMKFADTDPDAFAPKEKVADYFVAYRGSTLDCGTCQFKERCCPNTPARKIPRSIHEDARDRARSLAGTPAFEQSRRERKRVEMLFAHLKRILKMGRLRLRGSCGAQDEFTLAAIAQNLRRLAKLAAQPPPLAAR